jgi:ATP-binding cassette, subfamily B, bacterial MsbA
MKSVNQTVRWTLSHKMINRGTEKAEGSRIGMTKKSSTKMTAREAYGRLWHGWVKKHWAALMLSACLMVIIALTTAGYAKFMEFAIGGLEARDADIVFWAPVGIIALTLTRSISSYANVVLQNRVLSRVQADMQREMYDTLVDMDLAQLLAEAPAAIAARFSADIELVRGATVAVFGSLRDVLTLVATVAVMLSIDWGMTLALMAIFALIFIPVGFAGSRIRNSSKEIQQEIAQMTSSINEGLSGIRMVRTYQLEDTLKKTSNKSFERLFGLRIAIVKWQAALSPIVEALAGVAVGATLYLVALRIQTGAIDIAGMIGLITALGVLTNPGRKLTQAFAVGAQGISALERVYSFFDTKNTVTDGKQTVDGGRAKGQITFDNVDFIYPDGYQALKDINLTIEAGKTYAFVGRSGAGKTTVFNLLPRLFDTSKGTILLDGQDIKNLTLKSLRDQISLVSQDSILLSGTVTQNIGFGRKGADEQACIEAAKSAAAHGFISKLPKGYDTVIEPSKATFSGGERQRLSIARAIVRNAPILLLDEPTSALDAESEASIKAALDALSKGRTTLVIAHRLSTILHADQIVVMDAGQIVAQGTHDELLDQGGLYADLFNLQFDMSPSDGSASHGIRHKTRKLAVSPVERIFRMLGFSSGGNV